jgi:hypothetical protein
MVNEMTSFCGFTLGPGLYKRPRSIPRVSTIIIPPCLLKTQTSTSGTQSPPLEATGSEIPMGVCSIDGTKPTYVPDMEQRKGEDLHIFRQPTCLNLMFVQNISVIW